jgi:thioredoxin-like negative regulator of GroEL
MDYKIITSKDQLDKALYGDKEEAALVYFSHENCNVCKVLRPKVAELISNKFPKIDLIYSDTQKYPEISGQYSVFTVPTILVFFDGREYIRESRFVNLSKFEERIHKLYEAYFES